MAGIVFEPTGSQRIKAKWARDRKDAVTGRNLAIGMLVDIQRADGGRGIIEEITPDYHLQIRMEDGRLKWFSPISVFPARG